MANRDREPRNGNAMRIGQAAELLGISTDTLRRWAASGKIRVRRSIGGRRLVGPPGLGRGSGGGGGGRAKRPRGARGGGVVGPPRAQRGAADGGAAGGQ